MQTWAAEEVKARFSEFLDVCLAQGPQIVTRRGTQVAVLVSVELWRRLQTTTKPSLKDLLLSDKGRGDLVLPKRG